MPQLNNNQRKFVEKNHDLIYSFLDDRDLDLNSTEDWYGAAAVGLCRAALLYDESYGDKFVLLAYIFMEEEMEMERGR